MISNACSESFVSENPDRLEVDLTNVRTGPCGLLP